MKIYIIISLRNGLEGLDVPKKRQRIALRVFKIYIIISLRNGLEEGLDVPKKKDKE